MLKKSILLVALAAALVTPAIAGATVKVTENNKALAVGAEYTLTTNLKTTIGSAEMSCGKITDHLKVLTNGPNHILVEAVGGKTVEKCELTVPGLGSFPATVTEWEQENQLTVDTWGKVSIPTFVAVDIPALGLECTFAGTLEGEVEEEGSSEIVFGPSSMLGSGTGCPAGGVTHGKGAVETSDKTPVIHDFVETR